MKHLIYIQNIFFCKMRQTKRFCQDTDEDTKKIPKNYWLFARFEKVYWNVNVMPKKESLPGCIVWWFGLWEPGFCVPNGIPPALLPPPTPGPCAAFIIFLYFDRRFWNQIFTWKKMTKRKIFIVIAFVKKKWIICGCIRFVM